MEIGVLSEVRRFCEQLAFPSAVSICIVILRHRKIIGYGAGTPRYRLMIISHHRDNEKVRMLEFQKTHDSGLEAFEKKYIWLSG